jgi:hypothetical protein
MLYPTCEVSQCGPQGINQSASVGRVWPGQPQGVVLVAKPAQVAVTDDHSTGSILQRPDEQVLIYCGSILQPLYVLTLQCTAHFWQRLAWDTKRKRCHRVLFSYSFRTKQN